MASPELDINYLPQMPGDRSRRIAIAGAGSIVTGAHLPAYAMAGFEVAGIWNRTRSRAEAVADRFGLARVYTSVAEMVDDESVEIVDIALVPAVQREIVAAAAANGKHILCQKPLHEEIDDAREIVAICRDAGVKLNVNQQLRHDGRMRTVAGLFARSLLGRPTRTIFDVNVNIDFSRPLLAGDFYMEIMYHSIHYLDVLRALFGEPARVYCSAGKLPGQLRAAETRSNTVLEFDGGHTALIVASANNRYDIQYAKFRFEGTEGTVTGDMDLFAGSAAGHPTRLNVRSTCLNGGAEFVLDIPELRVPHSFIGPMASLMLAIEQDGEPDPGGADNLATISLVQACYRSAREDQAIAIAIA